MGKIQDFLSKREISSETREVNVTGIPFPFVIRAIGQEENKVIKKTCTKTYTDKKSGQRITETDVDAYNNKLIAACCVEPNFKDAAWQADNGVMGEEALIEKVLKPGEFLELVIAIQSICGFDADINDEIEAAKN